MKILPLALPTTDVDEDYCCYELIKMHECVWTQPQGMMGVVGLDHMT